MVTKAELQKIMPALGADKLQKYLPFLVAAMRKAAIEAVARQAAFLAQLAHESGEFRYMEEIWGPTEAQLRYEPPSSLATRLGNTQPGDGFRYKGRGPIQITGRDNYQRYGAMLGIDLVGNPALAATPEVAFDIAATFWKSKGLNELADVGDFTAITKRINGGLNGLADRKKYWERAKAVLGGSVATPASISTHASVAATAAATAAANAQGPGDPLGDLISFVVAGHRQAPGTWIESVAPGVPAKTARGTSAASSSAPLHHALLPGATVTQSVLIGAAAGIQRGAAAPVTITAQAGRDVVLLHIADGPTLTLHPDNARDLLLAQQPQTPPARGVISASDRNQPINVPTRLQWRGLDGAVPEAASDRGVGGVLLRAIEVVTGVARDPAADLIASKVVDKFDGKVDAGVYLLKPESLDSFKGTGKALKSIPAANDQGPILVLLHGTFSDAAGTFCQLWTEHPDKIAALFERYGNRVYALEHPTLGVSPIGNALALARALPTGANVHLLTHSRGGLVAEVLARVCGSEANAADGLDDPQLRELATLAKQRKLKVERVVRVACPARGTLLASKRLDAYLSVVRWSLQLAGVPIAPQLLALIGEVAQRRTDAEVIPGLAAQMPDSPLVQWLHAAPEPLPGQLRVVAGDMQGDSIGSWLKTLLSDGFYWTDNDLVVQTRSMYGGAARAAGASFVLDRGAKVSHFDYFRNALTATAIVDALLQEVPVTADQLAPAPAPFQPIGPLSWAGEDTDGLRAASPATNGTTAPDKPAVFILPGILGSNLKVRGKRVWLGWRVVAGLGKLAYADGVADEVEPDGPVSSSYNDLVRFLSATHEVIEFGYDWRRPIEDSAKLLAQAVEKAMAARSGTKQPVRLLAHSMGGLLARTMQIVASETWDTLMSHPRARLLMLGTPNAGSWAPMQVLSGDDKFGNALVAIGAPFQDHSARSMMAGFPGFIQLQAQLIDSGLELDKTETWQRLADDDLQRVRDYNVWHADERQLNTYRWGVPPQHVLDAAVRLRGKLDAQWSADAATSSMHADKLLLVVGASSFTPDGYELGNEGLVYLNVTGSGDGRVPLHCAMLPGVKAWKTDAEHGSLSSHSSAFDAYVQLLEEGSTNALAPVDVAATDRSAGVSAAAAATASAALVRSRPSRGLMAASATPPASTADVMAAPASIEGVRASSGARAALRITVTNGSLAFAGQALMVGHYRSTLLTGTEAAVDRLFDGAMSVSLRMGEYAGRPKSHRLFMNPVDANDDTPTAAIVVGLGEEGKLRASELIATVRQGVIAWSQRLSETRGSPRSVELAATLLGSGGSGISAGQAASLIAQGVREANERLRESDWPKIAQLHLVELYLDRASEAWRALQMLASTTPGCFSVAQTLRFGHGALRRPLDSNYRGAAYDYISAIAQQINDTDETVIAYTLDTRRARTEVRAQACQTRLLHELVVDASNQQDASVGIGRTLFQLLIPPELEPFMVGTTDMVMELDSSTAGLPWELLDTSTASMGGADTRPWAIRSKLLRKLRAADFREVVVDASSSSHVLVIGEPLCDRTLYPSLPGARAEAWAVAGRLTAPGALPPSHVRALVAPANAPIDAPGPDARSVMTALLERDWRIVHISGHGAPREDDDPRGVVLSNGTYLGPREICNMRVVPELVFVNCCHLAARPDEDLLVQMPLQASTRYDRAVFAAGVADQLIKIGVRCVVAAGWAVDDLAAQLFATTFYESLLKGQRFMDAVAAAREAAWDEGSGDNTWAAYQCYGDPDWVLRRDHAEGDTAPQTASQAAAAEAAWLKDTYAGIAGPPGVALALETLAINARYGGADPREQQRQIEYLETRFASLWGDIGAVAEAFGLAWLEAGNEKRAIAWYRRAVAAEDGSASMRAVRQLEALTKKR